MTKKAVEISITLPFQRDSDWRNFLKESVKQLNKCLAVINCQDWQLNCRELKQINSICEASGVKISSITSSIPETIVSAKSLGLTAELKLMISGSEINSSSHLVNENTNEEVNDISFQKGTLRAGENLDIEGDVLFLGDVNPGASISAGGNVMVWGRLLGNAHAGKNGNNSSKIIALQLRPVQLRIGNKVARGPTDLPEPGLAEQAQIEKDQIVIIPAQTGRAQKF